MGTDNTAELDDVLSKLMEQAEAVQEANKPINRLKSFMRIEPEQKQGISDSSSEKSIEEKFVSELDSNRLWLSGEQEKAEKADPGILDRVSAYPHIEKGDIIYGVTCEHPNTDSARYRFPKYKVVGRSDDVKIEVWSKPVFHDEKFTRYYFNQFRCVDADSPGEPFKLGDALYSQKQRAKESGKAFDVYWPSGFSHGDTYYPLKSDPRTEMMLDQRNLVPGILINTFDNFLKKMGIDLSDEKRFHFRLTTVSKEIAEKNAVSDLADGKSFFDREK